MGVAQHGLEHLAVAQVVGGSNPLTHPSNYPRANRGSSEPQTHEGFSFFGGEALEFSPQEMVEFIKYLKSCSSIWPRTYFCKFSFFISITNFKRKICFGTRPEDLADMGILQQKAWERHQAHLNRLTRFPLDKAEYYQRLKEYHAVNTVRGLSKITGEDWSYIAKILRILALPEPIKDFLRNNKNYPDIVKFFTLRRLLNIVRQGEERLQLSYFRQLVEKIGITSVFGVTGVDME